MKIALVSLDQFWEDKKKNLNSCEKFIKEAVCKNVDLIVFPEMTLTGFSNNIAVISEEEISNNSLRSFSVLAAKYNIAIIFGMAVKNSFVSNCAYFIDGKGEVLAGYQKVHPFSFSGEDRFYVGGNKIHSVFYSDHKIGLTICYDLRFPELYSALAKTNDLIINIANWPSKRIDHWRTLLKSRAIENQVFIIGVNRVGIDGNNLEYYESSEVYNANGECLAPLEKREFAENEINGEMKIFCIDKSYTKEFKKNFNTTVDRKIEFYKTIL